MRSATCCWLRPAGRRSLVGSQRWLDLGFVRFQPSEIMKIAVPLMLAWHFADKPLPPRVPHLLVGAVIAACPSWIAKQPDLGTGLVVFSRWAGLFALFLGGMSWKIIFGLIAAIAAVAPGVLEYGMREYQRQRVRTLSSTRTDPLGAGYHIIQSKIAIGSGGVSARGWLNGAGHLEFLPESHTDFILGTFAEEFGLIGVHPAGAVLPDRRARAAPRGGAGDTFRRIAGGTLALVFFFYAFVSTGMVSGILPVVGDAATRWSAWRHLARVTIMAGFGILHEPPLPPPPRRHCGATRRKLPCRMIRLLVRRPPPACCSAPVPPPRRPSSKPAAPGRRCRTGHRPPSPVAAKSTHSSANDPGARPSSTPGRCAATFAQSASRPEIIELMDRRPKPSRGRLTGKSS